MSLIGSKRLQQGIFEALASQNRTAGSGGGSGLGLTLAGTTFNTTLGQVINAAGWTTITGSAITLVTSRPTAYAMFGSASLTWTAGANPLLMSIFVDGTQAQNNGSGPLAANSWVTCPMMFVTNGVLQPQLHTVNIQCNPQGGNYTIGNFDLYVFALA